MAGKELVDYVKKTVAKGFGIEQIKEKLNKSGYSEDEIHDALEEASSAEEEKSSNIKVFLLIFFIAFGVLFTFGMIYKLVSNTHNFKTNDDTISAAVVMNTNNCAGIDNDNERDLCFYAAAKGNKNEQFCHRVESNELKDFCLSALTGTQINCSRIIDEMLRRECEES